MKRASILQRVWMVATLCLTALAGSGLDRAGAGEVVDRIVAVVNDDIISLYEWNQAFEPISERIEATQYTREQQLQLMADIRRKLLDQLIEQKLTDQELKRNNVTVSEQEVDFAIEQMKEAQSLDEEAFERALAAENLTFDEFREKIKTQLLRNKLVNLEIRSKIVITRAEIEEYYRTHPEEFGGKKTYYLRNIVMLTPNYATEDDIRMIEAQMAEIERKLAEGESFESLARLYSQAPTAADGGELGGFELAELSRQLRDEVAQLDAGQCTPALQTDFGYQLIYVDRIEETPGKALETVEAQIFEKLSQEVINDKYNAWLESLKQRSHIKIMN